MNATKSINRNLNSLTITFPSMPPARFLDALNGNGWRWSRRHRCCYADVSEENHKFADAICAGQIPPTLPSESKSSDGGMAQANEEAYFDNFCRNNGL